MNHTNSVFNRQRKIIDVDVAVVGAGPGGCMLSYLLARSGVRTALLERHHRLDREFRGYFFQPSVVKLFDQIGLLEDILHISHQHVSKFTFVDHGKTLFEVRFDELEPPYNYGLNIPQPPLLEFFIGQAARYPNFTYFGGTAVTDLIEEEGAVHGLIARNHEGDELEMRCRLLAGADGRHSTIRKLAGLSQTIGEFEFDFVWFDMPQVPGKDYPLQIQIEDEGMLIYIPKGEDQVQVGWVIPKKTYPELVKKRNLGFRPYLNCRQAGSPEGAASSSQELQAMFGTGHSSWHDRYMGEGRLASARRCGAYRFAVFRAGQQPGHSGCGHRARYGDEGVGSRGQRYCARRASEKVRALPQTGGPKFRACRRWRPV